ncbi:hypothetical protein LguiA_024316 [Lonicera macranthoides]
MHQSSDPCTNVTASSFLFFPFVVCVWVGGLGGRLGMMDHFQRYLPHPTYY